VSSDRILVLSGGKRLEVIGKNLTIFRSGILLSFSIDFPSFPDGNGDFSCSFWPVLVVFGDRNQQPGGLISVSKILQTILFEIIIRIMLDFSFFEINQSAD
jgi:hypothetical protein